MTLPAGVRAAFKLEASGGRMACIVSSEVFTDEGGCADIFHEFVHCHQGETCEQQLMAGLDIARKAKAKGDYMGELNRPFPYRDKRFAARFDALQQALLAGDEKKVSVVCNKLKEGLSRSGRERMRPRWRRPAFTFSRFTMG
ncbi:MAG: hypothetical protein QME74_03140 [Candidatus Edwardsbacteria bacterium]|nr:hypothetical protein [Candidatus Edwardsbacteria bacterium]